MKKEKGWQTSERKGKRLKGRRRASAVPFLLRTDERGLKKAPAGSPPRWEQMQIEGQELRKKAGQRP